MKMLTKQELFDLGIEAIRGCHRITGVVQCGIYLEIVWFNIRLGDTNEVERACTARVDVEYLGRCIHKAREVAFDKWLRGIQGEEVIMEEQVNTVTETKINRTTIVLQAPVNDEFSCMWLNGEPVVAVMTHQLYLQLPPQQLNKEMRARGFDHTTPCVHGNEPIYVQLCGSVDDSGFVVVDVNAEKLQELLKFRDELKHADKYRTRIETGMV